VSAATKEILRAFRDFLRGFVGLGSASSRADEHARSVTTEADARAALSERAARRPSCC